MREKSNRRVFFSLVGFPEDQIQPMLGSYCPNLLYPYARAAITDAVVQGGFPQLYLSPVNLMHCISSMLSSRKQKRRKAKRDEWHDAGLHGCHGGGGLGDRPCCLFSRSRAVCSFMGHDAAHMQALQADREKSTLPGCVLPPSLSVWSI